MMILTNRLRYLHSRTNLKALNYQGFLLLPKKIKPDKESGDNKEYKYRDTYQNNFQWPQLFFVSLSQFFHIY